MQKQQKNDFTRKKSSFEMVHQYPESVGQPKDIRDDLTIPKIWSIFARKSGQILRTRDLPC